MAELAYTAAANANQSHTVTRSTGTSVLGAGEPVAIQIRGDLTGPRRRAAIRACIEALRRDLIADTDPGDLPTSGTRDIL